MAFPIIFANLAAGAQPLSDFDTMFSVLGNMSKILCTASGTNSITLTPVANMPAVPSYVEGQMFSAVIANTTTGSVSAAVGGLSALPVYGVNGVTQLGAGSLSSGGLGFFIYSAALNSGAGGFFALTSGAAATAVSPTVSTFLSGSGTYTVPGGAKWLEIQMIGGGGGGSGSGTSPGGGAGGNGGSTTLGTSLLVANGGTGGVWSSGGGAGGTASLGSASGIALTGAFGQGSTATTSSVSIPGASGAGTPFGGPTMGQNYGGGTGTSGTANTGTGGQGGSANNINGINGAGGGAGGYVQAIIGAPSSTYAYAVGAAGNAGSAGPSGYAGGAGGSGGIWITEHYNY